MQLSLQGIGKTVGGEMHLADISADLTSGLNVVLGPTGAGKTSLLRLIAGLDRPTAGKLQLDGRDITALGVSRRNVAMVYQQFVNYPSFTVYDNIASPLRQGTSHDAKEIDRRVREAAALLHIEAMLDRLPSQLSGGQQQRTAIARAIVKDADLLLLDEPLVNLDYKLREELRAEMRSLFTQRKTIVVYATTEPSEALLLGGSTMVLDQGRLLQFGPTLQTYHHPMSTRVGTIFSDPSMNLLAARIEAAQLRLSDDLAFALPAHMANLPAGQYRIGVRATHVSLASDGKDAIPALADVELAEISGSETFLHLRHGPLNFIAQVEGVHPFDLGAQVTVYLNRARLYAFDGSGKLVGAPIIRDSREGNGHGTH
jgi:glycerol transport system ATP-binding protein